jgi:hypothetical protein
MTKIHLLVISGAIGASPVLSRTFDRLPRAVGSASAPTRDRVALVDSSTKPLLALSFFVEAGFWYIPKLPAEESHSTPLPEMTLALQSRECSH